MAVWLPDEVNATRPKAIPTLASKSKIDASHKIPTLFSVADGLIPQDENDRTIPYYHWYPKTATTEWISYEFPEEVQVSLQLFIGLMTPLGVVAAFEIMEDLL